MTTHAHPTDRISAREERNRALSEQTARECIVLLENDGALPLRPCRIALYGAGAGYTIAGGSGSGEVNVRHIVTVEEGLARAGFTIATVERLRAYDRLWKAGKAAFIRSVRKRMWWPRAHFFDELMAAEYRYPSGEPLTESEAAACGTDACVYVVSRQSGEGHDLTDAPGSFQLNETEIHDIRLCAACFARFILVINTGCPIDLTPLDGVAGINAVVSMSQLGMEGGTALASVLTGESTPSGKLAVSWPRTYADVPFGDAFGRDPLHARYKEGIYVGYRYYDSFGVAPRYPFGFGRSYTGFSVRTEAVRLEEGRIVCTVRVTNTGSTYAGKEVVQLYVRCPGEDMEYRRLVAFGKTELLAPGASETLRLAFSVEALAHYDEREALTVVEEGAYLLCAGTSSRDTEPVAILRAGERYILRRHRHLCAPSSPVTELHHANRFDLPAGLNEIRLTDLPAPCAYDYAEREKCVPETVRQLTADFTAEDYIRFCAGTGYSGEKAGFRTPGAVGHTTTDYIARGIRNAEMCDGPAGVRLEKRAVLYPDGDIRPLDVSISLYEFFPDWLLRRMVLGNPDKGPVLYQYVTGFPIEAAVAQTWNTALAERMGRAVSEEMSEFGVTFWLAPAINIVRNPLCGRNYEYYSEDPLVTGLMAAAVTRGVQATPGNHVTIKHFCANNQEADRYSVSSDVDERALREIYWKGFETAIRESGARSVMTAYNRLNGTYCANSKELCTDLLRGEWAFEGVVMTDWMSTGDDRADEAAAIRAGVDIIMPGGKKEVKKLQQAYRKGILPESDIRRAALRVLRAIIAV